jgi:hypothetical protein
MGPPFRGAVADSPDEAASLSRGCRHLDARRGARCVGSPIMSPPTFLLSELELLRLLRPCVWVRVLTWRLACMAEHYVA